MGDKGFSKYSMSFNMYGGASRGYGRPKTAPPDLPSLLLDARICYLGLPVSYFSLFFWCGLVPIKPLVTPENLNCFSSPSMCLCVHQHLSSLRFPLLNFCRLYLL